MDIYAEDLEDALDPADGADPEKIRQLARDLGMPSLTLFCFVFLIVEL